MELNLLVLFKIRPLLLRLITSIVIFALMSMKYFHKLGHIRF